MAVRIRSLLVSGPLLVPLSSGGSIRLSPGEVTDALDEVDVTNSAKVDKLRERRLIDVQHLSEDHTPAPDEQAATVDESNPGSSPAEASPRGSRSRKG